MKHGISVVLLAYKEADNLRKLLPRIHQYISETGEEYEVLVIDTAEPLDDTEAVCAENNARYINQRYQGFGGAMRTGIEEATMDRFISIDSDGAHDPSYIPRMVSEFSGGDYDVVIGSRYVRGGGTNDPYINVMMSKLLNGTYGLFFGLKAHDLSTNFRMYNTEDLKPLELTSINYDVLQEILIKLDRARGHGLKIGEFPIILQKRISGKSKRRLFEFMISYIKTLIRLKKC